MSTCPLFIKPNEGTIDRIIRVASGSILLIFSLAVLTETIQIVIAIAGLILLGTGIVGFCGLYTLLGITTIQKRK